MLTESRRIRPPDYGKDVADTSPNGYAHPKYAAALSAIGRPRRLPASGGYVLESEIDNSCRSDARGCYPLFCCRDWKALRQDLDTVKGQLVSIVIVTDPFGDYDAEMLRAAFPDLVRPYKQRLIVDLHQPLDNCISRTNARYARAARNHVTIERPSDPQLFETEWTCLYDNLIRRHAIRGVSAFSSDSLRRQLRVPGIEMFRAVRRGEAVAAIIFYVMGDIAYYHLGASSEAGYRLRASYALFDYALRYFSARVRWVDLGAGAGIDNDGTDGLTRFKRGWANCSRTAYLCGRVFDQAAYRQLVNERTSPSHAFFPAYRCKEPR